MAYDVQNSTSQSLTYEATGTLARDMHDAITRITPDKTPFLSALPVFEDATATMVEWMTDELRPPQKNQHSEWEDYTFDKAPGIGILHNHLQYFQRTGSVSDIMLKVKKEYTEDEMSRLLTRTTKEMAKDMEYALMTNRQSLPEVGSQKPMMGGVPFYLEEKVIAVTFDDTTNIATTASAHTLLTGNYVVFEDDGTNTKPDAIEFGQRYFIRQDATNPNTAFTLHNDLYDAIENRNPIPLANAAAPSTITANMLCNNVVDGNDQLLTEAMISDVLEMTYNRGGEVTELFMSGANKKRFTDIMTTIHTTHREQSKQRVDNVITEYESEWGLVTAHGHRDCTDSQLYAMDMGYWGLKYLTRPHVISNAELPKTGTYQKFVMEAQMTLQASQPLASGLITNLKRPPKTRS